jgi:hypothetical protein
MERPNLGIPRNGLNNLICKVLDDDNDYTKVSSEEIIC